MTEKKQRRKPRFYTDEFKQLSSGSFHEKDNRTEEQRELAHS